MDASVRYQYTTNLELSGDSRQPQLREGEKGGDVAAGGWSQGSREVAKIAGLWAAGGGGRLGPSKSRFRFRVLARRRRRRRWLFLTSATLHSGVYGEPVEVVLPVWSYCVGVVRRRLASPVGR
jgi:hypothetical protein